MSKRNRQHHGPSMAEQIMRERERQARKIPSDEDFAKADAAMDRIMKMATELRDATLHALPETIPLHDLWFWGNPEDGIAVVVFYKAESDVNACGANGTNEQVEDAIHAVLKSRDDTCKSTLSMKYDSHEYVQRKFNGSYYKYFR